MHFFTQPKVVFYEKTGCKGNRRQKELLKQNGVVFEVKSMLDTKWSKAVLEDFFKGLEKEKIYNAFAPQVKSKAFTPEDLTKEQMIEAMVNEPILIKRPLLEIAEQKICGFDTQKINEALGLNLGKEDNETKCLSSDKCD